MRVGADLEALPVLALVHVRVHVAHDRVVDRRLRGEEARHRADVDHLVHRRRQRDGRARHARDPRRPHAARDHDDVGLEVAARRAHAAHATVLDVDAGHLGVREDLRAFRLRLLAHERPEAERVDDCDGRRVEAAEEDRLVHERDELLDLRRRDESAAVDAPRLRRRHPAAQFLHPLLRARDLDPAALVQRAGVAVLAHRLERELRHLLRVVDREDEVGRVAGRAARVRKRPLVELDEIGDAELGEPAGEAVADDAAADDDDLHTVTSTWRIACSKPWTCARISVRGPVAGAVDDREHEVPVRLDRLLEGLVAIEGDHPDAVREHVVLAERLLEQIVVRGGVDRTMDALVDVHQVGAPHDRAAELGELVALVLGRALGGEARRLRLERLAHLGDARKVAYVDIRDEHAAARKHLDQLLVCQPAERFAHRRTTDAEPLDERPLVDHGTRRQLE